MKGLSDKEIVAAILPIFVSGLGLFAASIIVDPRVIWKQDILVTLTQPFYFSLLTIPFSGFGMALIGVPIYLVLRVFKINYPWLIALLGGPAGYLFFLLLGGGQKHLAFAFAVCGWFVSGCSAMILRTSRDS